VRAGKSTGMTERTSYVIDKTGKIAFVHSDLDYKDHVRLTLAAVKKLRAKPAR
jgi:peroxiredoxin Q/BCP